MRPLASFVASLLLCSNIALAQNIESEIANPAAIFPQSYGSEDLIAEWVPLAAFQTRLGTPLTYAGAGWGYNGSASDATLWAPIEIPHGGRVVSLRPFYFDNSAAQVSFYVSYFEGLSTSQQIFTHTSTDAAVMQAPLLPFDHTINYFPSGFDDPATMRNYAMVVGMEPGGSSLRFRGVMVYWKRQMSTQPSVPTFSDVPFGSLYYGAVEALAASGITGGCGGGKFCPNDALTRWQMAMFLTRALGLHWPVPPAP
jgi:hypothetical protein